MTRLKLVVVTMVQASSFPSAYSSLRPLGSQLSTERQRIVLLNDVRNTELEQALSSLSHTTVLTPGHNLGVAKGRNLLFRSAIDRNAEVIVSLDGDLYVPCDCLDEIDIAIAEAGADLGVHAPTVMKFASCAESNAQTVDQIAAVDGRLETTASSVLLRGGIIGDQESMFFHLGVRDWKNHYLYPVSETARNLASILTSNEDPHADAEPEPTFLASDPRSRAIVVDSRMVGIVWVDSVGGGASVFAARMFDDIGMCDERFSPFGFGDSDMCIRALQSGYRVGWTPRTVLLHEFRNRVDNRSPTYLNFTSGRAHSLLASTHLSDAELVSQIAFAVSAYSVYASRIASRRLGQRSQAAAHLASVVWFIIGYLDGATRPTPTTAPLLDRLADVSGAFAHEAGEGLRWNLPAMACGATSSYPTLTLKAEVKVGEVTVTSATVGIQFLDGFSITMSIEFSRATTEDSTSSLLHSLSVHTSSTGPMSGQTLRNALREELGESGMVNASHPNDADSLVSRLTMGVLSGEYGEMDRHFLINPTVPIGHRELANASLDTAQGLSLLGVSFSHHKSVGRERKI